LGMRRIKNEVCIRVWLGTCLKSHSYKEPQTRVGLIAGSSKFVFFNLLHHVTPFSLRMYSSNQPSFLK
jgi:hypothetical protein